jgi:repressor LexA
VKALTKSQRKIFDFVTTFIQEKGYSPTFRDIQSHFGFSSLGSVYTYIKTLKRKGLLHDEKRTAISLTQEEKDLKEEFTVPLIGYLAAGFPLETFPQSQPIPVPYSLVPNPEDTYIMRAKGDTLIDEHIIDGDLLLIEARSMAHEGELVVAHVQQNDTLVKRFFPEGLYVRLESSDASHEPIILNPEELTIQGVIIGLLRGFA